VIPQRPALAASLRAVARSPAIDDERSLGPTQAQQQLLAVELDLDVLARKNTRRPAASRSRLIMQPASTSATP